MINDFYVLMMKRGISPLISSVLMIAFVIALFVLITSFVQRTSETAIEGTEGQVSGAVECGAINLDIDYACVNSLDHAATPVDKIKLDIDNGPEVFIKSLKIRVIGDIGSETINHVPAGGDVAPFDRIISRDLDVPVSGATVGDVTRIEVIPEIESGLCGNAEKGTTEIVECA